MDRLEAALNAKREEMHGPNWRDVDWYGTPIQKARSAA